MKFRDIQIIWLSLVGGVSIFTAIAYALLTLADVGMGTIPPTVMPWAAAVALAMMLAGLGLRRRAAGRVPGDGTELERLRSYFAAALPALALIEGAGLSLIVLSIVADAAGWTLAGGGAAVGMLVIARPRREDVGLGPPPR